MKKINYKGRWERQYLLMQAANMSMQFGKFYEIYAEDKKKRVRENTWASKEHIFRTKILPYFEKKQLNEIHVKDVIAWQNKMLEYSIRTQVAAARAHGQ